MKSSIYILFFLPLALAFNSGCKMEKKITKHFAFESDGNSCEYIMIAPKGSKINMQCSIYLPVQDDCTDNVFYSQRGNFDGSYSYYCKSSTFDQTSDADRFAIGINITNKNSKFSCVAYISTPLTSRQCDCGWKVQKRIIGGSVTGLNEYPFMVSALEGNTIICGAVIISKRHALTTAYAISGKSITSIIVGDHDNNDNMDAPSYKRYPIKSTHAHPSYNTKTEQNDIAILLTETEISFGVTVGPVCLPFYYKTTSYASSTVVAIGWGGTTLENSYTNQVNAANFTALSLADCRAKLPINTITDKQICTYNQNADTCQHDIGGPVVFWNPSVSRYLLVGLISYGLRCSPLLPGINTRVTSYLDWIESQAKSVGVTFCKK